jgi:16S rRNA (cytosine1402-N4)-methyltransferase
MSLKMGNYLFLLDTFIGNKVFSAGCRSTENGGFHGRLSFFDTHTFDTHTPGGRNMGRRRKDKRSAHPEPLRMVPDRTSAGFRHAPIMVAEILSFLSPKTGGAYADATLGGGGHARSILERSAPDGRLVAVDRDPDAIRNAENALGLADREVRSRVHLFRGLFTELPAFLERAGLSGVDGLVADLGLSLYQLEGSGRGFSLRRDEPLDMRMDPDAGPPAEEFVNGLSMPELADLFRRLGEERFAGRIARAVVRARERSPIRTSARLAGIVAEAVPAGRERIHPATRVFMALRIAVNRELELLERFMAQAPDLLNPGGRLCVLTFHSLEDRIVKHRIREMARDCVCPPALPVCACSQRAVLRDLTPRVLRPSADEIDRNPMARSAKLRVAEKIDPTNPSAFRPKRWSRRGENGTVGCGGESDSP